MICLFDFILYKLMEKWIKNPLPSYCYSTKELVIEDQGRDCAEALVRMKNIESLTLENYSWHHNDER